MMWQIVFDVFISVALFLLGAAVGQLQRNTDCNRSAISLLTEAIRLLNEALTGKTKRQ